MLPLASGSIAHRKPPHALVTGCQRRFHSWAIGPCMGTVLAAGNRVEAKRTHVRTRLPVAASVAANAVNRRASPSEMRISTKLFAGTRYECLTALLAPEAKPAALT